MLMRQTGIEPRLVAPDVDEDAVVIAIEQEEGRSLSPEEHVLLLARAKALDVARRLAQEGASGLVVGGDSMFELDGRIHGKPHTVDRAVERWRAMRGRTGVLHSGLAVARIADGAVGAVVEETSAASVSFAADVDDAEIAAYVATGEPLEVAGAFTVDSLGSGFIERVDGDPSTVVGMSLSSLRRLVRALGVEWTALWNRL